MTTACRVMSRRPGQLGGGGGVDGGDGRQQLPPGAVAERVEDGVGASHRRRPVTRWRSGDPGAHRGERSSGPTASARWSTEAGHSRHPPAGDPLGDGDRGAAVVVGRPPIATTGGLHLGIVLPPPGELQPTALLEPVTTSGGPRPRRPAVPLAPRATTQVDLVREPARPAPGRRPREDQTSAAGDRQLDRAGHGDGSMRTSLPLPSNPQPNGCRRGSGVRTFATVQLHIAAPRSAHEPAGPHRHRADRHEASGPSTSTPACSRSGSSSSAPSSTTPSPT